MKKRGVALGLVLTMAASLAACGGSSSSSSSTSTTAAAAAADAGDSSDSGEASADSGVTGDYHELAMFAGSIPETMPTGVGMEAMAQYINDNSNGTLNAITYYDTALGDATSMVQGLQQGTVDIGVSGTAYYSGLVPEVSIFELPFLFSDLETARAATAGGEAVDIINEKFEAVGIVGLSFWENGFRELSNNVHAVKTPDDMKGIKMRTLASDVQRATWEAFGAMTAQIDASELYTALQQGTVDAQDNPLHEIVSRKFYEVQKYITLTDATYTPFYMSASKITWDSLSESQQALIREAAAVGREAMLEATDAAQAEALQTLIDNGCEVEEEPDKEAFKEIAMSTWSLLTDQTEDGARLLEIIQAGME
ncbi:MAG: DctP family TRAP transporter solute-binding subunit [Clostridiales bacterium]|nr:DctP family TRAP transporter solute-binding subunit [Clostridiales bacterium]